MPCLRLFMFLFYLQCASASFQDAANLLETFENATEAIVSEECQAVLQQYLENLGASTDQWALQMLDASSKIPVGLSSYNLGEVGQFRQCLNTQSEDGSIQPRYCLALLPIDPTASGFSNDLDTDDIIFHEKVIHFMEISQFLTGLKGPQSRASPQNSFGFTWSICLPTNCTHEDVEKLLTNIISAVTVHCHTKEDLNPPLTDGAIAAIVVFSFFAFLLVASTGLDLYYTFIRKKSPHVLLLAFSMYTNGTKLFKISRNSNELACLNGIRFYSMVWVVMGHVFVGFGASPLVNLKDLIEWLDTLKSMTIISGTLSVDTFFMLGGTLLVYSYFKSKHNGVKFSIFQFYIHRYLRLTPALAAVVLLTAHLLRYIATGPRWHYINSLEETCQKYWWTTLLYVQNYVNTEELCLAQTWYLSIDMQLFILSPLVLIPLWRYPKIGQIIASAGVVAFIIVPFCIAYINELPGLITNISGDVLQYTNLYYTKTHTRAAPWFIGILLGYILARIQFHNGLEKIKINKAVVFLLWVFFLCVTVTCIYAGHGTLREPEINVWANSFYIALVKPVWTLCLAWIIFACVTGYGGPINWFLSLPIYQVFNRFTYSIYLLHYPLILVLAYKAKTGVYFDEVDMMYSFWGITMFTFIASIFWVLAFESPIVVLEKVIFGGFMKSTLKKNGTKEYITP